MVSQLHSRGFHVFPFLMHSISQMEFPYLLNEQKFKLLEQRLIELKPHVVVNLSWITHGANYNSSPLNETFANFAKSLLEICTTIDVRHYIAMGSSAEYGLIPGYCDENNSPLAPYDLYSNSKVNVFKHHLSIAGRPTLVTWLRLFQLFSFRQPKDKLLPKIIDALENSNTLTITNSHSFLDWISLSDAVDALVTIIDERIGGTFNLGSGIGNSVEAFVSEVCSELFTNKRNKIIFDQVSALNRVASPRSYLLQEKILECRSLAEAIRYEYEK